MKGNTDKEMKWEILHSEYLIQRPWLTARRDHIRMPDGVENIFNLIWESDKKFSYICKRNKN